MLHSTNGGDIEPTKLQCNVGSLSYSEGIFKAKLPSDLRVTYALNADEHENEFLRNAMELR